MMLYQLLGKNALWNGIFYYIVCIFSNFVQNFKKLSSKTSILGFYSYYPLLSFLSFLNFHLQFKCITKIRKNILTCHSI